MNRSHAARLLFPMLALAMSANALPLSSLDQSTPARPSKWGGLDFMRAKPGFGVKVPLGMKLRWYARKHGSVKGFLLFAFALLGLPAVFGVTGSLNVTNSIYQGGNPRERCIATFKVKTVTSLRGGVFVMIDTTDSEIMATGAAALNCIGVMSELNWTDPDWDSTAAPTAGDIVTVILINHGARVKVRNGANIVMGSRISSAAAGRAAAVGVVHTEVGRALESADGSGTEGFLLAVI